jgi:hypothetical protein
LSPSKPKRKKCDHHVDAIQPQRNPVWLVVFGLFALFGSSMTFTTGVFVVVLGTLALTIMLILWKAPPSTIAEVLRDVDASRTV